MNSLSPVAIIDPVTSEIWQESGSLLGLIQRRRKGEASSTARRLKPPSGGFAFYEDKECLFITTATHSRKLCTVVPISSTAPQTQQDWHHLLHTNPLQSDGYKELWVKCDMIYTVSFERLDKLHRKTRSKGREYFVPRLGSEDMQGVIAGVKAYLPL